MLLQFVLGRESFPARVTPVGLVLIGHVDASDVQVQVVVVWEVLRTVGTLRPGTNYFQVDFLDVLPQVAGA